MKHTIKLEDFKDVYSFFTDIASSYGNGSYKTLMLSTTIDLFNLNRASICYILKEKGNTVLETASLEEAIKKYNELP